MRLIKNRTANMVFARFGQKCKIEHLEFYSTFVLILTFVLLIPNLANTQPLAAILKRQKTTI